MQALKKFSVLTMYAALSLSGPSAWAADSFVVRARLSGNKVVPSVLSVVPGELCLTISKPEKQPIGQTPAQAGPRRPGLILKPPANFPAPAPDVVENVRLYFGQRFANGQPILTLCDDHFEENGCHVHRDVQVCTNPFTPDAPVECEPLDFDLNSVQFQSEQIGLTNQVNDDGRLLDCDKVEEERCGFLVIKRLIKRGLIYVVVNSDFKAKLREDGTIRYKPPKRRLAVDGDLRGTLRLVKECSPLE